MTSPTDSPLADLPPEKTAEFDPGLTRQFDSPINRAINKDGSFNVRRTGSGWRGFHPWLHVNRMSWAGFMALVLSLYFLVNTVFAFLYFAMDPVQIHGAESSTGFGRFINDFFFSAHTLTTVGYGSMSPAGIAANVTAALEALAGLMGFAVITGVLIARVSRPSAQIGYSRSALIAPFQGSTALMFRIANERPNNLMEMQARVMLMTVEPVAGRLERRFGELKLERQSIVFFPLPWTIVHPITTESPLFGKTAEDLTRLQAEVMILVKGFDETFSQTVQSRYSYRFDEVVFGAKFQPSFHIGNSGSMVVELEKLGDYERVPGDRS